MLGSRTNEDRGVMPIDVNNDVSAASEVWQAELIVHFAAPSRVLCIGHTWPGPTPGQQALWESDAAVGAGEQRTIGAAAKAASWTTIQELTARRSELRTVLITSYIGLGSIVTLHDLVARRRGRVAIGGDATAYHVPENMLESYGAAALVSLLRAISPERRDFDGSCALKP